MPPPSRRRPVQPATRVRLPRTARPRGGPASETEAVTPAAEETAPASVLTDETAADETTGAAGAAPSRAGQDRPGTDEQPAGEPGGDRAAGDRADEEPEGTGEAAEESTAGQAAGGYVREPLLLPVCLGIVAVALGGLAVWFGLKSGGSTAGTGFGAGTPNAAVTDRTATAQVTQQIDNAVDRIFSYNYTDTARTASAAKDLLTGPARAEYAKLFRVVQQQAPKEKLVLTTTVTNSGVEMLNGNAARLLIFANQKDTGAARGSTTEAGAMFAVTAVKQGGQWKIENIDTFSAPG